MLQGAVDEQGLQWGEKIARWIGHALLGLPALLGPLALAKLRAQFFQDSRGARYFGAADFEPLKLGQQVAARRRRQPLQVILNLVGPYHGKQFPKI